MNILILNGSPRGNGVTSFILKEMLSELSAQHVCDYIETAMAKIAPCTGCLRCRPDKTCILPEDDAHRIAEKIRNTDMLIIGTPTYWGNMTGVLKGLFDRSVPVFEYIDGLTIKKMLKGRKAVIVTASAAPFPFNLSRNQSGGTVDSIKHILRSGGIRLVKVFNIPGSAEFEKKKEDIGNKVRAWAKGV